MAGATAIGIGTALFYDPLTCKKINEGIVQYLDEHQLDHVTKLVGALELNSDAVEDYGGGQGR